MPRAGYVNTRLRLRQLSRPAHLAGFVLVLGAVAATWLYLPSFALSSVNTPPTARPVKLVFIHHPTGQAAWLYDACGGLGLALRDNNSVSDPNYGWGAAARSAFEATGMLRSSSWHCNLARGAYQFS